MTWPGSANVRYQGSSSRIGMLYAAAKVLGRLRYYGIKTAVSLMPSARTAAQASRDRRLFAAAGVRQFVGFRSLASEEMSHAQCPGIECTEAYLRLKRIWGAEAARVYARYATGQLLAPNEEARKLVESWLGRNRRHPGRPLVCICPFSNLNSKHWSQPDCISLTHLLEASGHAEVVLLGGAKDREACEEIIKRAGCGRNAAGLFAIPLSAALLKASALVVSVDSGPMHLSAAVGTPTVAIFSRTAPYPCRWFPMGTGHTVLYRSVECAGCGLSECPIPGHPCMTQITATEVFRLTLRKLSGACDPEARFAQVTAELGNRTLKHAPPCAP